jgi:heat shock protein HtpX
MWEQIRSNRFKSALLFALGYFGAEALQPGAGTMGLAIALGVWIVMVLVSYYGGDGIFLGISGARKIEKQDLPVLYNVVEEMTIASGLKKMPDVYVIDDPAPNAFATGRDPDHAAVAVTSGLLTICSRDELQGVVAHELGHVRNRDTLLMLMTGVLFGVIVILADVGRRSLWFTGGRSRSRRSSGGGGQAQLIILVVALLLLIIGPLVAQLIYFAISRRREYLADASSATFTRYPDGLASALEKISAAPQRLIHASRATAPLYIINPLARLGNQAADLASTHPPTSERIRILRSMAGASLADYERACSGVRGGGVLPASALAGQGALPKRQPEAKQGERERARKVNDFFWKLQNYLFLACACGTVLKLPPDFSGPQVRCPHCGVVHGVADFKPEAPPRPGTQ